MERKLSRNLFVLGILALAVGLPMGSSAQNKVPAGTFLKLHPPLMKNLRPQWVQNHDTVKGPESTGTWQMDTLQYLRTVNPQVTASSNTSVSPKTFPLNYTTYYEWRRVSGPTHIATETTLTHEVSVTDSTSVTTALSTRLSATVEAELGTEFAKLKASLTAELSSSLELQRTHSTTVRDSIEVKLKPNSWTADWVLMRVVHLTGTLPSSSLVVSNQAGLPDVTIPIPSKPIDETYAIPVNTYRDSWQQPAQGRKKKGN